MSALWTGWSADATTNGKTFTCFATGFSANTNFMIGGANDGVYRSDDGIKWIIGTGVSSTVTAVASNSDASFMCCTTATTIYYSNDQGANWTSITNQPSDTGYTSICCGGGVLRASAIDDSIQIIVGSSRASGSATGKLWYYNGVTSSPTASNFYLETIYVTALVCTDNTVDSNYFIAALSDNAGSGITPDHTGLAYSTDGINWTVSTGPTNPGPEQTWSSLAYDAGSNIFIACSRDDPHYSVGGQVYSSVDNGLTWNLITSGVDAFYAPFSYVSIVTGTSSAPNLYACVPSGGNAGLWNLFNYGGSGSQTWTKDLYSPASSKASAIVVDIGTDNVGQPLALAVAGESAGVYQATFGATPAPTVPTGMVPIWKWQGVPTFTPLGEKLGVNQIVVCSSGVNSNNLALVACESGIYVLDGKGNVLTSFSTLTNIAGVAMSLDGSKLYAIEQGNGGVGTAKLYVSKSGGSDWPATPLNGTRWTNFATTTSKPSDIGFSAICCDANGQNVVVTTSAPLSGQGSVYYCADPSVISPIPAWTTGQVSSSNITSQAFTAITCTPENGLPMYVALSSDSAGQATGHIYSSVNGTTWFVDAATFEAGDQGASQAWTSAFCLGNPRLFFITSQGYGNGAGINKGQVYRISDPTGGTWENFGYYNYPYQDFALDGPSSKTYLCALNTNSGTFFFNGGSQNAIVYDSTAYSGSNPFDCKAIALNQSGPNVGLPLYLGTDFKVASEYGLYIATYNYICFKSGSKILCLIDGKESYVPVETMRPGTLVKTARSGYKKVDMIGSSKIYNPAHTLRGKDRLYVCNKTNYPEVTEDLIITGCHSILVKSLTDKQRSDVIDLAGRIFATDDHYRLMACLDDRAHPYTEEGVHTIWHFALENNDYYMNYGVYANGLLVETTSKRMMKELSGMELL